MDYKQNDGGRCAEYNIPPLKKNLISDCVIRSIAIGLNQSYKQTLEDLCKLSVEKGSVPNDPSTYEEYLFSKGWVKNKPLRDTIGRKKKLKYWRHHRAIVHTTGHLTAIVDNCINDTFDTREWCGNSYYTLKQEEA